MRRFTLGGTSGQAIVEYALGIVLVAFLTISGTLMFGPAIKAHMADYDTSYPEVRWGGLALVINPTDRPAFTPTSTSAIPPTWTSEPTVTDEPTITPTPSSTLAPTLTSTPEPTSEATATPTSTPAMSYEEWCDSMGYTWRPWLEVCTYGWVVVTPPPP